MAAAWTVRAGALLTAALLAQRPCGAGAARTLDPGAAGLAQQSASEADKPGGHHGGHGEHAEREEHEVEKHGGHGHGSCVPKLQRPSSNEMALLRKLMVPNMPGSLGHGQDVSSREEGERPDYDGLELVSAWKVDPGTKTLQSYLARVDQWNAAYKGQQHWVHTAQDASVEAARKSGALRENEYWSFHGGLPENMEHELCRGSTYPGPGAFGTGVYVADVPDKMDQYVGLDEGAQYLEALLGARDKEAHGKKSKGVYVGYVMRTYFGHHAELMTAKGKGQWYWRDPASGATDVVSPHSAGQKPPFEGVHFDSVKVMCSRLDSPRHGDGGWGKYFEGDFHGNFPYRFNEYLLPSSDQVAIQYLVVYERVLKHHK